MYRLALRFRDATDLNVREGHLDCTRKQRTHGFVERVLDPHGNATAFVEHPLNCSEASVLTSTEVQQGESTCQELVGCVACVTHAVFDLLGSVFDAIQVAASIVDAQCCCDIGSAQRVRLREAAYVLRVLPRLNLKGKAHGVADHEGVVHFAVAHKATGLVHPVAAHLVAKLHAQLIERALDGVPDTLDEANVEVCCKVSEVFLHRLSLLHATGIHGSVHRIADGWVGVVDRLHQAVELLGRDQSTQTNVTNSFVGQHKVRVVFRQQPVGKQNDFVVPEGVALGRHSGEVTLRAGSSGAVVELTVLVTQLVLVAVHIHTRLDRQLAEERTDQHLHPALTQGLVERTVLGTGEAPVFFQGTEPRRRLIRFAVSVLVVVLQRGDVAQGIFFLLRLDVSASRSLGFRKLFLRELLRCNTQLSINDIDDGLAVFIEIRTDRITKKRILLRSVDVFFLHLVPQVREFALDFALLGRTDRGGPCIGVANERRQQNGRTSKGAGIRFFGRHLLQTKGFDR